jgi:hypothetical protein
MKNQYFGDENDYKKYGLLRILTGMGEIETTVCWMLTPDGGKDGGRIEYLEQPDKWQHYDSELFCTIRKLVQKKERNVCWVEKNSFIPATRFYSEILHDKKEKQDKYYNSFWKFAKGSDLIFFDPDKGIEVKKPHYGLKGSSQYLYWNTLKEAYSQGYSVLVYQHFHREEREKFIANKSIEIRKNTGAKKIYSFRTSHVVFFLLLSKSTEKVIENNISRIRTIWGDKIKVQSHKQANSPFLIPHS